MPKLKAKGFDAIAMTDHGTMAGSYEFYKQAIKANIKPIIGIETYYTLDRTMKGADDLGRARPNYHMILLAKNKQGYKNLVKLNSIAYIDGFYYDPRIDDKLLEEYSSDLIATSACLGSRVSQLILKGNKEAAQKLVEHHAALFPGNYFLELQAHDSPEQAIVNEILLEFSKKLNIPIVYASDSHYVECHDKEMHDKFLAIATNQKLEDPKRFTFHDLDCSLPDEFQVLTKIAKYGIPEEAVKNTKYISDMIKADYFEGIINRYPTYQEIPDGLTADQYLDYLVKTKYLEQHNWEMPSNEIAIRIEEELLTIKKMGFSDYMLILWDIVENGAKKQGILTGPGRGSAAGSIVSYILGITKVDPIKYNLLFSRFLNSGRSASPVIF